MAGFVVAPNTVKVLIHWTWSGRPQLNVLHGQYTTAGPLNPNIAETIFSAIKASTGWTGARGSLSPQLTFTGVGVLDERSPSNPEILSTSAAVVGTGAGVTLPPQNSIVVTLRTALTGRSHRGRFFMFGWIDSALDPTSGLIGSGTLAIAQNFVTAISQAMSPTGAVLAIKSPALPERPSKPGGTLPAKPFEITPVTQIVVRDNIMDTNRRRLDIFHR